MTQAFLHSHVFNLELSYCFYFTGNVSRYFDKCVFTGVHGFPFASSFNLTWSGTEWQRPRLGTSVTHLAISLTSVSLASKLCVFSSTKLLAPNSVGSKTVLKLFLAATTSKVAAEVSGVYVCFHMFYWSSPPHGTDWRSTAFLNQGVWVAKHPLTYRGSIWRKFFKGLSLNWRHCQLDANVTQKN